MRQNASTQEASVWQSATCIADLMRRSAQNGIELDRGRAGPAYAAGGLESSRSRCVHGGVLEFSGSDILFRREETSGGRLRSIVIGLHTRSPGHEMGKLDFSDLRIEMLGPEAAFVAGRLGTDDAGRQDAAWAVYADLPQVRGRLEDCSRPYFGGWE